MELTDDHLYSVRDRDLVVQVIHKSDRGNKLKMVRVVEGRSPMCRVNGKVVLLSRDGMDINILDDDRALFQRIGTIKVINSERWYLSLSFPKSDRSVSQVKKRRNSHKTDGASWRKKMREGR